jgi:DNA-binding beta-propeller fold protein YncE
MTRKLMLFLAAAATSTLAVSAIHAQTTAPAAAAKPRNDSFQPRNRHLIYVTLPGSLEAPAYRNGLGIVVLDAENDYLFVKRIPTWDVPASMSPEQVAGVTASPITNMIYVAARGRLGAWDLGTDKMVWSKTYDGVCCERPQVTADGKYLVVGSDLKDFWYVIDPRTGDLLHKLQAPLSPNAHNLVLGPEGKLAFMSPNNPVMTISNIATGEVVKTITFGDHIRPFVLNHDASLIYANVNNLDGFEVADAKTGKIIHRIENSGDWKAKWNATPKPKVPHGCPSHGIALVNNEKEIWVTDGINNLIHIYDNTGSVPKEVDTIKPTAGVYWITVGLDGKYAYLSSGDIVDTKTRKIVGQMKDEYGLPMYSEKLLDMTFVEGKLQRVANQFGNGFGAINAQGETEPRVSYD